MALIKCPECGKEVSNKSPQCIHCGYPLSDMEKTVTKVTKSTGKYKVLLIRYNDKIKTIKAVKDLTNLSLVKAKELVENHPSYVVGNVAKEESEYIREIFAEIGSVVKCEEMGENDVFNTFAIPEQTNTCAKLKKCTKCGRSIISSANSCHYCGYSFVKQNPKSKLIFFGSICVIIVAILIMMFLFRKYNNFSMDSLTWESIKEYLENLFPNGKNF